MKKLQFKNNYKKIIRNIVITVALAASVSGVLAYLTASDKEVNTVTVAHNQIVPVEKFEEPIMGEKTVKEPQAENVGNISCYVRAKILLSDSRAASYIDYYYKNTRGFNTRDWAEENDGWLYYQSVLDVGELTTPIFDHIQLKEAIPSDIDDLSIDVIFESVQSTGYSGPIEAFASIS